MKKTPKQIMAAYKAVHELALCVLPYKTTRDLHRLKKAVQDEFDAILITEQNMVAEYGGKTVDGAYKFPTVDAADKFHEQYSRWLEQEDDVQLPHVDVSRCIDAIRISSAAVDALEGLVDFGED